MRTENKIILGIFLAIIGAIVFTVLVVIPWASSKIIDTIPKSAEIELGEQMYKAQVLQYKVDSIKTKAINEFYRNWKYKTDYPVKITVVKHDELNAYALPGGNIVVFDDILKKMNNYNELQALLAHEMAHVYMRHTTKTIFKNLGFNVLLNIFFSDFGSLSTSLISNLTELKFSREYEEEADKIGLEYCKKNKISPQGFIDLFNMLKKNTPENITPTEFLSSHPDLENRKISVKSSAYYKNYKNTIQATDSINNAYWKLLH